MRKWLPLLTVCLGTLMLLIDVTIVNVALPAMADDLQTSFGALQWVIDAYALALAALVLGAGSIADLIGHRKAYIGGLALFAVSSLVCGIAPSSDALIAARAVQGVGAAIMFATTFALLNSSYSGRDRGVAYGMWGAVAGASTAVGPVLGGILTETLSWRWIFFVNLPISVVAIALCLFVLVDVTAPYASRVDVPGIVTFSGAAAGFTYALIQANEHGWATTETFSLLAASALLLFGFVMIERRSDHPMFDLGLLRHGSFVGVVLAAGLLAIAAFTAFTYISIWMQSILGLSPIQAGLVGLPMSFASFVTSAMLGRVLSRTRPGPLIGGGLALIAAGSLVSGVLVHGSASWPALIPGLMILGVGVGLAIPTLNAAAMAAVPLQRGGMAAGTVNTSRQLGFAFGIAILGTVFTARAQHVLAGAGVPNSDAAARALAGGQAPRMIAATPEQAQAQLSEVLHSAATSGVQATLLVAAAVGAIASVLTLVLVRTPAQSAAGETAPAHEADVEPDQVLAVEPAVG